MSSEAFWPWIGDQRKAEESIGLVALQQYPHKSQPRLGPSVNPQELHGGVGFLTEQHPAWLQKGETRGVRQLRPVSSISVPGNALEQIIKQINHQHLGNNQEKKNSQC